MGRGGFTSQDRGHGQSHATENNHVDRNSDSNRANMQGSLAGGIHSNNDRNRDMPITGGPSSSNPADSSSYPSHISHPGDRPGNVNIPTGSGGHGHSSKFAPAPEFEMKGNDFPALPGAGENNLRKASESSEGANAWSETNR